MTTRISPDYVIYVVGNTGFLMETKDVNSFFIGHFSMNHFTENDLQLLIKRVTLARKYFGLSQLEMANICKISNRTYQRIEYGESDVTLSMLLLISDYFKINLSTFFNRTIFFEEENFGKGEKFPSCTNTSCLYLFKRLSSEIEFFLQLQPKSEYHSLSKYTLNELHLSPSTMSELAIAEDKISIAKLTDLTDLEIILGHEFIMTNSHRVIVNHCNHNFGENGKIETIDVVRCPNRGSESPFHYMNSFRVEPLNKCNVHSALQVLSGLKSVYNDKILVVNTLKPKSSVAAAE